MKNEFVIRNGVLISYNGKSKEVIIPDEVTAIGDYAFVTKSSFHGWVNLYGNWNVQRVQLPSGIKTIGKCAFFGCYNLEIINIPEGVTRIEERAFTSCHLTSLSLPESIEYIGEKAFSNCSKLSELAIPQNVKNIYPMTFMGCDRVTRVSLPDGLVVIQNDAFRNCKKLTQLNMPKSLEEIGDYSFANTRISNVIIPDTVSHISQSSFYGCEKIKSFEVSSKNKKFVSVDGVLYNRSMTTLIKYPQAKTGRFSVPQGIKRIGESAFCGSKLTHIVIPDSVEKIDSYAFWDCNNLKELSIPSTVKKIGDRVILKGNIEKIENLSQASVLSSLPEPEYSNIKYGFFPNDDFSKLDPAQKKYAVACYLTNYSRYPDDKKEIYNDYIKKQGGRCLSEYISAENLEQITLLFKVYTPSAKTMGKSLEEAGGKPEILAFLLDYQNSHFNVKKEQEKKEKALEMAITRTEPTVEELKKLWIVKTCEDDKNKCYLTKYKGNEKHVVIPAKVGKKKVTAIEGCFSGQDIHSVEIPDSVTSIGDWAFSRCTSLENITIPDSVTSIGYGAFAKCSNLATITIPDSVTSIKSSAFEGCEKIIQTENGVSYVNGWVTDYDTSATEVYLRENTVAICDDVFSGNKKITNVTIPDRIKSISHNAFSSCSNITNISIGNGVSSIGDCAFGYCSSLTSITMPDSLKRIGESAFDGCTSLMSITIPDSVKRIEDSAFSGCSKLTSITIPRSVTKIGRWAFEWCSSLTSVTIPDSVTSIGGRAFSGCTSLENVTIPDCVKRIEDSAFSGCSKLTSITVPGSVTKIGDWAFEGCSSLTSVTFPDSVTNIGYGVFESCSNLLTIHAPEGSYAEKYTKENNIKFEPIEE